MLRRISELDFEEIVARIARSVNSAARKADDPVLQADIDWIHSTADAIEKIRNNVALAIVRRNPAKQISFDDPLVQALIRCQHHPEAQPIPIAGPMTDDTVTSLETIISGHPELSWNPDAVQSLIVRAVQSFGEHELDDQTRPELMYWGPASPAATALIILVALRKLGYL